MLGLLPLQAWAAPHDPVQVLDTADFVLSDAPEPPPDSAPWRAIALPDNWDVSRPDTWGYGWYRIRFEWQAQPEQLYAALLPALSPAGAIYVNGAYAGQSRPFAAPNDSIHPQVFTIAPSLLHPGANTLLLRLRAVKGWHNSVSPVSIGGYDAIRPKYERRYLLQVTGPQFVSVLSVLIGLFMLTFWLRRPHDAMFGYFGLSAVLWSLTMPYYFVDEPPLSHLYWDMLSFISSDWADVFALFFAIRFAGWRWRRAERGLLIYAVLLVPAAIVGDSFAGEWYGDGLISVLYTADLGVILCFAGVLIVAAQRRQTVERVVLTAGAVFEGATAAYEVITIQFLQSGDIYRFYPYYPLPLYLAIAWILLDQFVRSLNEYEKLNVELEERVAQKGTELEQNYLRIRQMEQERAVIGERARIMSDMHDGVGGQLISTLSLVEAGKASSDEVAAALRECIDDLRLTIDSLEPTEHDLLPVLGNLRYRLDRRLKAQGIDLDWRVMEMPKLACLTPQNVLHVLRILQEAFTNVLKHARASEVSVETGVDAPGRHAFIRIRDNGAGFAGDYRGYGLGNMQRRAKIIGGDLAIESSPSGTTLSLTMPLD